MQALPRHRARVETGSAMKGANERADVMQRFVDLMCEHEQSQLGADIGAAAQVFSDLTEARRDGIKQVMAYCRQLLRPLSVIYPDRSE